MNWFQKNFRTIIYISFLVPILAVAFVSISHVASWYGLSNPVSWAIYLSVGIEIAALSALAAISAKMGKKVYFPFGLVTVVQFVGNIFFAYKYINLDSQSFKDWVDMVGPLMSFLGVESGDMIGHRRFLAFFSGGMLPIISLSFLHMLIKFEEEDKKQIIPEIVETIEEKPIKKDKKKKKKKIESIEIIEPEVIENINSEETKVDDIEEPVIEVVEESKLGDIEEPVIEVVEEVKLDDKEEEYAPTQEDLLKVEEELKRLNEKKFNTLVEDEVIVKEVEPDQSGIKRISYLRRDG
jgi:hypothetical protein